MWAAHGTQQLHTLLGGRDGGWTRPGGLLIACIENGRWWWSGTGWLAKTTLHSSFSACGLPHAPLSPAMPCACAGRAWTCVHTASSAQRVNTLSVASHVIPGAGLRAWGVEKLPLGDVQVLLERGARCGIL